MHTIRNDITKVKEINVELIKSALKGLGTATKAQIAEATEISVATCGKILNELCESGEVMEAAVTSGGYGRPAKSYVYNGNYSLIACVYVASDRGKVTLSSMVCNLLGEVQEESTREIERATYDVLEDTIRRLTEKHAKLRVASIGIPGYITNDVIGLCNFVDLMGLPLRSMLQEKFPDIKILVENDMNAAAYGFYQNNCGGRDTTIAFIYSPIDAQTGLEQMLREDPTMPVSEEQRTLINLSINFGAGFVSGGHILRGFSGFAGEVSFLPVVRSKEIDPVDASVESMSHIIGSIVPVLNPEIVALTGGYFDKKTVEEIRARCLRLIAPQHMPQIILRANIHEEYVSGLLNLALEELSCGVMLVKRKA
ncbi:ROK family protein [Agathobaculum sp. NTUH-O15-33]|uniref:ROK family protein n=1 Tax=Agathobaculum sp. NTUH-O15-33 TaxID=3079302 RepID=UPI002958438B|nr:ROK family protein [Agathobaculum sp. NTUH-O15-33]WNX84252.1 ROK family protein [Agathobaculum sp. NTUH-O15-33]